MSMGYETVVQVESKTSPGVTFAVAKMSFGRRVELMRRIRALAERVEFLDAGHTPEDQMDGALLRAEIDRVYLTWGLAGISGLELDGEPATPTALAEVGPEELFREALAAVKAETGLTETERKN
jgi:hypothetical protein